MLVRGWEEGCSALWGWRETNTNWLCSRSVFPVQCNKSWWLVCIRLISLQCNHVKYCIKHKTGTVIIADFAGKWIGLGKAQHWSISASLHQWAADIRDLTQSENTVFWLALLSLGEDLKVRRGTKSQPRGVPEVRMKENEVWRTASIRDLKPLHTHTYTHVQTPPTPAQYSPCSCKTGTCVTGWSFFCALLWLAAGRWPHEGSGNERWKTEQMGFNTVNSTPTASKHRHAK